jgi:DNA-binding MarR family transcriptional regulator
MSVPLSVPARSRSAALDDPRWIIQCLLWALKPLVNLRGSIPLPYAIVFLLVALDEGRGVGAYARDVGIHRWRMSRYLRDIGARSRSGGPGLGLVAVLHDSDDHRYTKVVLTDKGRAIATDVFRQLRRLSASPEDAAADHGVNSPQSEFRADAQFDNAAPVAKLKATRVRKRAETGKSRGRKSYAEAQPEMVKLARELYRPDPQGPPVTLREVAAGLAERGFVAPSGKPYRDASVASMLRGPWRPRRAR